MNSVKIYDDRFNLNEWAVISMVCVGLVLVLLLPRRFPTQLSILFFMCGVTTGFLFDHILSVLPVSFYDVNDTSKLELADFILYWGYGPVSYLFFYLYDLLKVKAKFIPVYTLVSASLTTCIESGTVKLGIFHYRHGYWLGISFVVYLMVHSAWIRFFHLMKQANANT